MQFGHTVQSNNKEHGYKNVCHCFKIRYAI